MPHFVEGFDELKSFPGLRFSLFQLLGMMFSWLKINHSIGNPAKEREDSKATTSACLSEAPVGGMGIAMETAKHTRM